MMSAHGKNRFREIMRDVRRLPDYSYRSASQGKAQDLPYTHLATNASSSSTDAVFLPVTIEAILNHLCQKTKHQSIESSIESPLKRSVGKEGARKDVENFVQMI